MGALYIQNKNVCKAQTLHFCQVLTEPLRSAHFAVQSECISQRYTDMKTTPFLIRLKPETRALLDAAAEDQRRSRASIIDELVRDALASRYGQLQPRLQRFLGGVKQ